MNWSSLLQGVHRCSLTNRCRKLLQQGFCLSEPCRSSDCGEGQLKLQVWNEKKKPKQPKCISYLQLGLPDRRAINPNQVLVGHETTNLWLSENQHAIGGTRNQDGVHPIPLFAALRGCKGITVDWTKNDWISLKGVEVLFQTFPSSASCSLYISTCCCQSWGHCPCSASLEFPFPESLWLFQDCVEVECENRLLLSRDLEALAKRSISTYSSPHWFSRFPRFLAYEYLSCFDNAYGKLLQYSIDHDFRHNRVGIWRGSA